MMKKDYIQVIFIYVFCGILNKKIVENFPNEIDPIILKESQLENVSKLDEDRKKLIYNVYKEFGNLADLKLREMVMSEDSPVGIIFSNPTLYYLHLTGKVGYEIPKLATKEWFKNNFLEY